MGHSATPSASLRAPLRHRSYRVLLGASTISQSGDWLYNVALAVYVFDRTGSAGWVAAATVLRLVPYVLLAPIGGLVADRFDRRSVMIWSDVAQGVAMGALAAVAAVDGPVLAVTLLAFATTAFGTAYVPAMMAVTPELVGEDDLAAANALNTLVDNLTVVVGPAVGAAILALTSPTVAFALNALSFAVPALLLAIGLRRLDRPPMVEETSTGAFETFVGHLRDGFRAATQSAGARVMVAFLLGVAFIYGAQTVALVLASDERFGTGPEGYGYLLGALGAGGVIAAPITNRLAAARRVGSHPPRGARAHGPPARAARPGELPGGGHRAHGGLGRGRHCGRRARHHSAAARGVRRRAGTGLRSPRLRRRARDPRRILDRLASRRARSGCRGCSC